MKYMTQFYINLAIFIMIYHEIVLSYELIMVITITTMRRKIISSWEGGVYVDSKVEPWFLLRCLKYEKVKKV